jgi:hypothetical protein
MDKKEKATFWKPLFLCYDQDGFCGVFDSTKPIMNVVRHISLPDPYQTYSAEEGIILLLWNGTSGIPAQDRQYIGTRLVRIHQDYIFLLADLREMYLVSSDWVYCYVPMNRYYPGKYVASDGLFNLSEWAHHWPIQIVQGSSNARQVLNLTPEMISKCIWRSGDENFLLFRTIQTQLHEAAQFRLIKFCDSGFPPCLVDLMEEYLVPSALDLQMDSNLYVRIKECFALGVDKRVMRDDQRCILL